MTGAVVASHTIGGRVAREEMSILEKAGLDLHRFIWIHPQMEPDVAILKEAAQRGAFVKLDSVGRRTSHKANLLTLRWRSFRLVILTIFCFLMVQAGTTRQIQMVYQTKAIAATLH